MLKRVFAYPMRFAVMILTRLLLGLLGVAKLATTFQPTKFASALDTTGQSDCSPYPGHMDTCKILSVCTIAMVLEQMPARSGCTTPLASHKSLN